MKEPQAKHARRFYSFGPFRLYVAERELFRGTELVSLFPKTTDVLFELVAKGGHLVERGDLLRTLWPDAFVEEENLSQQISHLRKALGDGPDGKGYIETIPKRGYRFTARITEAWDEEEIGISAPVQTPAPEGARRRSWRLVLPAAALAVAGLVSLYIFRTAKPVSSQMEVRPLTSYPGIELWPSFSPDGNQVAFAWRRQDREDFDIYVKAVDSDQALQLTNTKDWDICPVWSPDGRWIAFDRSKPEGGHAIYLVSPLGGQERLVANLGGWGYASFSPNPYYFSELAWSADGKWLAYADRGVGTTSQGIRLLSVTTGEKRVLTTTRDRATAFSPDGQRVAFVRFGGYAGSELYVVSAAGGEPKRLAADLGPVYSLCWTADGREIIFSSNRSGRERLWRVPVSGGTPRYVAEAGEGAWYPSISRQGRLAFARQLTDTNIWRMDLPGVHRNRKQPARLIASTKTEADPQFSPDGKRIGFTSDRSGTMQVWVCNQDGSNAFPLTSFPEPGAGLSAWSPDGKFIAFNSKVHGNWDVYVSPVEGGTPRRLTEGGFENSGPSWSRDGRWVYFASNRTGRHEVWKVSAQGGTAVQVTKNGGKKPVESFDGRFVYYNKSWGLYDAWRIPVGGGPETPVFENLRSRWALVQNGLYFFEQEQDGRWFLRFFDFGTRGNKPVAMIPGIPITGQNPSVSPDGGTLLYVQWEVGEADLVLIDNFR